VTGKLHNILCVIYDGSKRLENLNTTLNKAQREHSSLGINYNCKFYNFCSGLILRVNLAAAYLKSWVLEVLH